MEDSNADLSPAEKMTNDKMIEVPELPQQTADGFTQSVSTSLSCTVQTTCMY